MRAHHAETGDLLWEMADCHRGGVTALQVSHNRKFLVTGGEDGEVRVWEVRTREMVVHLKQHTLAVTALKIYDDDSKVFSASRDRAIYLWDLRSEARERALVQRMGGLNALEMLPDHIQLVTVGQEKCLGVWDARETHALSMVPVDNCEQMCVHAFTPAEARGDARRALLATGGAGDNAVRLWRYADAAIVAKGVGHSAPIRSVAFSPTASSSSPSATTAACSSGTSSQRRSSSRRSRRRPPPPDRDQAGWTGASGASRRRAGRSGGRRGVRSLRDMCCRLPIVRAGAGAAHDGTRSTRGGSLSIERGRGMGAAGEQM